MPGTAVRERVERVWTIDDLDDLPDDGYRYECVDGQLVRLMRPKKPHQRLLSRLHIAIQPRLPTGWELLWDQVVSLGTDWRIPDLTVPRSDTNPDALALDPVDLLLVIEVVSPSSRRTDRVLEPAEYADAGIPHYWRFEVGARVELWTYALAGRRYDEPVMHVGPATGLQPFGVTMDLDALDPR